MVALVLSRIPPEINKATMKAQCEVYTSIEDFRELWEARWMQKQREIDEQMKGNKI